MKESKNVSLICKDLGKKANLTKAVANCKI